jgi:hemerythrin-like domain-containing protein
MSRRHDSLITLSHQHQHALALALVIKRRFGAEKGEAPWLEEMSGKIQSLYSAELKGHFEVEEAVLFPEMERYLGKLELVTELRHEHQTLRNLIRLCSTGSEALIQTLDEFSSSIEPHVRKEERQLFAEFEKRMPPEEAKKVGLEIDARLAKACPRH